MAFKNVAVLLTVLGFSCGDVVESIGEQKTEKSPGTFSGTVAGHELTVKSAVFGVRQLGPEVFTYLILTDVPDFCSVLKANRVPANGISLSATVERVSDKLEYLPTELGDYTVSASRFDEPGDKAQVGFIRRAQCKTVLQVTAISGLIKIDAFNPASGGKMSGTFDVTFGDQKDKATGTFNAEYCDYGWPTDSNPSCE